MKKTNETLTTATTEVKRDATGRRLLDKSYSGQKEMLAAGWTQAEIDALVNAPRSTPDTDNPEAWTPIDGDKNGNVKMPDGAKWRFPKVDGFAVCGTSLLTEDEKARYRAYIKSKGNGTTKQTDEQKKETEAKWQALLSLLDGEALEKARELHEMFAPRVGIPRAYEKLTGRKSVDDTVWTWYGMMYASPDGEKEPQLTKDNLLEKLEAGWTPVVLQKDIRSLLDDCKAKGITVTETVHGVTFAM